MMSAQMLSAAANMSGTVADLAPGAKDGMRMLEAKAAEMKTEETHGKNNFFIFFLKYIFNILYNKKHNNLITLDFIFFFFKKKLRVAEVRTLCL